VTVITYVHTLSITYLSLFIISSIFVIFLFVLNDKSFHILSTRNYSFSLYGVNASSGLQCLQHHNPTFFTITVNYPEDDYGIITIGGGGAE
jgi:hypothetical protein